MTTTEITPFTRPDDVWDDAHALASLRAAILDGWIGYLMGQMTLTRVAGDLH